VTLVADNQGIVRYYIPNPPALQTLSANIAATQKTVADQQTSINSALALQTQVSTLNSQLVTLQATHAQDLALRDQQIASLTATTKTLQTQLASVNTLQTQVNQMSVSLKALTPIVKPG
jgi:chromosome segregation ATPase